MVLTGIESNYNSGYKNVYASRKNETGKAETNERISADGRNEAAKKAQTRQGKEARTGNMERNGVDSESEYYSYLRNRYDCVKNGSVAISGVYLRECAKNPEKAKELEENLAYFKKGYESGLKSARANARAMGARVVNYRESWSIDSTGNITMMASTTITSDSGQKGWKELSEEQEERLKEKKEKERAEEQKQEKKQEQKAESVDLKA